MSINQAFDENANGGQTEFGPGWITKVAVFCGSRTGFDPVYSREAYKLGWKLAAQNIEVVYGGGDAGLMGAVKEGARNHNQSIGKKNGVIGVNPEFFLKNQSHRDSGVQEETVKDMFERKARFLEIADFHVALPGGLGTLDEIFEVAASGDITPFNRPNHPVPQVAMVSIGGFYDDLYEFVKKTASKGFSTDDRVAQIVHLRPDVDSTIQLINDLNAKAPLMPSQLVQKHDARNVNYRANLPQNLSELGLK